MEHNMKPREVKCIRCGQRWITDEMNADYPDCHIPAITVIKSIADGTINSRPTEPENC